MDQTHKHDGGKAQYRLIPPNALKEIADILTYGAEKYSPYGWVNVESERFLDAAYRHMEAFRRGEVYDMESGHLHLAMAATNLMFLVERLASDEEYLGELPATYLEEVAKKNKEAPKETTVYVGGSGWAYPVTTTTYSSK